MNINSITRSANVHPTTTRNLSSAIKRQTGIRNEGQLGQLLKENTMFVLKSTQGKLIARELRACEGMKTSAIAGKMNRASFGTFHFSGNVHAANRFAMNYTY